MKKLLCLLSAILIVLSSCSDGGDSQNTNSSSGLVQRTIDTFDDGSTETVTFSYNGNKILKISYEEGYQEFIYTADLISRVDVKLSDGTIDSSELYEYNTDNKLFIYKRLEYGNSYGVKEIYNYNADGTITISHYYGDITSQTQFEGIATVRFLNNEVSQVTTPYGDITYTYDEKNNPFQNVLGYAQISFADGGPSGILHNVISIDDEEGIIQYNYTYNSDNYPIVKTYDDIYDDTVKTQYFYE